MLRLYTVVILLHAYVGWRLLPDLLTYGRAAVAAMVVWLLLSAWLLPQGLFARRARNHRVAEALVWAGTLAMGSFSSLFVLSFLRDVGLLVAAGFDLAVPGVL